MPESKLVHDHVRRLTDTARSLGREDGNDLLLELLYLRWETSPTSEGGEYWQHLHEAALRSPGEAAALLEMLVQETIPFGSGRRRSLAADGGRALRRLLDEIDALVMSVAESDVENTLHECFEEVLRFTSRDLSKAMGEWETPPTLARLMAKSVPGGDTAIDPACGIGNAIVAANDLGVATKYTAYDTNAAALARAWMRMNLAGISAELEAYDAFTLATRPERYDAVLLQPPWGTRLSDDHVSLVERTLSGLINWRNGDLAWLRLAQKLLTSHGRAAVLLPHTALISKTSSDTWMRDGLISEGQVEAIIALPPGLATHTSIATALWILRGDPTEDPNADLVLMIDAAAFATSTSSGERSHLSSSSVDRLGSVLAGWRASGDIDLPEYVARAVSSRRLTGAKSIAPRQFLDTPPVDVSPRPAPPQGLLTELRVENYKSFGRRQSIPLAPITLIFGANSAGKSSVIQSLLLLKQSAHSNSLVTQGELTDVGSFTGIIHKHDTDRVMRLGADYGAIAAWEIPTGVPDPSLLRSFDIGFVSDGSGLPRQTELDVKFGKSHLPLRCNDVGSEPDALSLDLKDAAAVFTAVASGDLLYPFDARHHKEGSEEEQTRRLRGREQNAKRALKRLTELGLTSLPIQRAGLFASSVIPLDPITMASLPEREAGIVSSYVNRTAQLASGASSEFRLLLDGLAYLGPMRSAPQRFYTRGTTNDQFGAGNHVALYLFDNSSVVDQVNDWLRTLGVPYELAITPVLASGSTSLVGDLVAIVLTDRRSGVDVSPADVGFGVSQVLPVVVELLARHDTVICIEQPEIHLHPSLQARLGDLLIESTLPDGRSNQVIVETHSEHLVLRLQRRVRDGSLSPDQLSIVYVDQTDDGEALIVPLRLDEDGDFLDEWPNGFFDERLEELFGADA